MRIQNVQSHNYNQKPSFQGRVDESVFSYIRAIQEDLVKIAKEDKNSVSLENIDYAANAIPKIIKKLKDFMAKTSENTELYFYSGSHKYPHFRNIKTKTEIRAYSTDAFSPKERAVDIPLPELKLRSHFYRPRRTLFDEESDSLLGMILYCLFGNKKVKVPIGVDSLKELDKWSKSLVEKYQPKDIDKALLDAHKTKIEEEKRLAQLKIQKKAKEKAEQKKLDEKIKNFLNINLD